MPDYGSTKWDIQEVLKNQVFRTFQSAYANALMNVPRLVSNVAKVVALLLLRHHVAVLQTRSLTYLLRKLIFTVNNSLFFFSSEYCVQLCSLLKDKYDINVLEIHIDTVNSIVSWVKDHENTKGIILEC